MNSYQYSPLPEGEDIRVMTILPSADRDARIDCTIEAVPLNAFADYSALSYSWGMNEYGVASLCEELFISGKALPITRNLYQGLLRTRRENAPFRMWVDAVCIDQQDVKEHNAQVALMPSPYGTAASTVV